MGHGDRHEFQPHRLIPEINRDDHFLLTETATISRLAKSLNRVKAQVWFWIIDEHQVLTFM